MASLDRYSGDWQALDALLDTALDLPASARAAWLDGLSGEGASHREALRTLLARQAKVESADFLGALPALAAGIDAEPQATLTEGDRVGAYRLVSPIGSGGMGTVWLAERADGLIERRVALKLPRIVWGADFAERLARERQILASLEHENIARLYDAGLDAQGRPYLAMEHVAGEPIDVYCRSRSLTVRQRIGLVLQVAAAVSHAHSKLVVHRDLKPGNILVSAEGQVKLLDFGIAKLLEGDRTARTELTEFGGTALTIDYASPEQIHRLPLGTASDVYSLGVVAFELLADARPYQLKRGSAAEVEEAIAHVDPRRASDAAADPVARRQLRGDLDAILNKALKKSADERYRSVDAFAQDLERFLNGQPVRARPDSRRYRTGKFVRRHRFAIAMSSALAASVIGGAGVSLWQATEARQQAARARAEVGAQLAVRDLYMEAMMKLSVMAAQEPAALAGPHAIVAALQKTFDDIEPRYRGKPTGRDAQLDALALQLNYDSDFTGSLAIGRQYLAALKEHGAPPDRIILAHLYIGSALYQLQRWDEAEAMRRAAVAWAPDAVDAATVSARQGAIADLGSVLINQGRRAEAEQVLSQGEALMVKARRADEFTNVTTQLSSLYIGFDEAKALRYARKAHHDLSGKSDADGDERANQLMVLGTALAANGLGAEAEATLRDSYALFLESYEPGNRNVVRAFSSMIGAVNREGDYERAASLLADQRRMLAARPGGVPAFADVLLRARETERDWLAGNVARASAIDWPAPDALFETRAIADSGALLFAEAQLLGLAGRGADALALLEKLQRRWPAAERPTAPWVRVHLAIAVAQLEVGQAGAARQTASRLRAALGQQKAMAGSAYWSVTEVESLAAARDGDLPGAARALASVDGTGPRPPLASKVEAAESMLRRAEVLAALGRAKEAEAAGRSAAADLVGQSPDSPRLAQVRRFVRATVATP